jgi:hypothetical protein
MRIMWCWRCKIEVPMLDEKEFAVVSRLYSEGMRAVKVFREEHGIPLSEAPIEERFRPLRDAYRQMTGMDESNHSAIIHHRISIYGPDCERCGKPLRTPRASFCAACGTAPIGSEDKTIDI